jgi:hypothetical protein
MVSQPHTAMASQPLTWPHIASNPLLWCQCGLIKPLVLSLSDVIAPCCGVSEV